MTTSREVHYRRYLLACEPRSLPDGRFGAQIAITLENGRLVIEKRFPALEIFSDERDAIEYAKRWGRAWVDENE